jgi:hypothetical protein
MGGYLMIMLSSIIKTFEHEFLKQYEARLLPSHRKALSAMAICRTSQSPKMLVGCEKCSHEAYVPHSCGHRNCPHCQAHEGQRWLEQQLKKQVPADYFLLTFTLPAELRTLAWRHQRTVYSLMMASCWETVQSFSQNDKQLQGSPGAIAVLHTHNRRLDFHPHVHMVMPAAAINRAHRLWRTKRKRGKKKFLFSHKALAKVFQAKMLEAVTQAGLKLPDRYPSKWVVDCTAVGDGDKALTYLGRYLYRGVIQEKDIIACKDGKVTFRYQNSKTKETEFRTLPGADFLWLVMQHVLPKGFRRARNFGFLHPNSKRLIQLLHYLLNVDLTKLLKGVRKRPQMKCSCCGSKMRVIQTRIFEPPIVMVKEGVNPLAM